MKLLYTKDENNEDILQDESGSYQVMMEWEKPYMEACIEKLNPYGSVLEIGFGLGYSATKICTYKDVNEYTVIECNPLVWEKFEEWKKNELIKRPELKINIIKGRWQDVLAVSDIYDSVFFDDYASVDNASENNHRLIKFIKELLIFHIKVGTRISSYATHTSEFNILLEKFNCFKISTYEYYINIPKHCKYASGNKMFIPVIEIINSNFKENDKIENKNIDNNMSIANIQQKMNTKIANIAEYYKKCLNKNTNLIIIDNFYKDLNKFRKESLNAIFELPGIYGGKRTYSIINDNIKHQIESHIEHTLGKITKWDNSIDISNYNGCLELIESSDKLVINTNISEYNWGGILMLSIPNDINIGFGTYKFKDGTRYKGESKIRENNEQIENYKIDRNKWDLVDSIGYTFNRLILFNLDHFSGFQSNFGINKETANLIQTFYFSTEK
jgi:hypothetical protein